ncbi:unnamed protein product [Rodentolepis nana]|uniref:Coiled-coil domain-containing protein 39 n=1 Tax=Rodentolepis nana TaxID=102285 RepID=A0A0R3T2Y5_RODNA|nr:unnamed protein product [Rodentolepis nana]
MIERQKLNLEARRLRRQLNSVSEQREELVTELKEAQNEINFLTAKYDSIKTEPLELEVENEKIEIELRRLSGLISDTEYQIKDLVKKKLKLESSNTNITDASIILVDKNATLRDTTLGVIDKLDTAKRKLQELSEEEIRLRKSITEVEMKRTTFEAERRQILESSKQAVKRGGTTRKIIKQGLKKTTHLQETIKRLEANQKTQKEELELLKKESASKRCIEEREKLARQIAQLSEEIIARNEFADEETKYIQQLMKDEAKLFSELENKARGLSDLHRIFNMKSREVSQRKWYLQKAQLHRTQVQRDLKLQQFHLSAHRKTLLSLQRQLSHLGKLYKTINVERNGCLIQITLAQQTILTTGEKNCFHENELDILKSGLANKLDQLDEVRQRMQGIKRDSISIREELSKQTHLNRELQTSIKWLQTSIDQLKRAVANEEAKIGQTQTSLKEVNSKRDKLKSRLKNLQMEIRLHQATDRELEVKKKNLKEALSSKERELSLLLSDKRSETRSIEVLERKGVQKRKIEEELRKDKDQIAKAKSALQILEIIADVPSPNNSNNRLRFLEGSDPSMEALLKKEERLLSDFSKKETELQNNQLVLNIVDNLVTEMEDKKKESSKESLTLMKNVNSAYSENYKKGVEMKAACAELRMNMLYSEVLKTELKNAGSGQKPRCRGQKDVLKLLTNEKALKHYTSEIIHKLTISTPNKFFA